MKMKTRMVLKTLDTVRTMRTAFEKIDSRLRMHHHKIQLFQPNVELRFERGRYLVKTAENGTELEECLKLRFEVFHKEFMNKSRTFGVDVDRLDFICDHLVIIDTRINRTIGTYRLNCSKYTDVFYSTDEFHLERLLAQPGHKLEMGRACIDREYRNGTVMALLWSGIAEYTQATQSEYLFGCSSIKTMDRFESALIYKWLRDQGHLNEEWGIVPTRKFRMPSFAKTLEYIGAHGSCFNEHAVHDMVPALFHSYIKAGAKLCGEPALDREFGCIDFLTLLKMDEMSAIFAKKFKA